MIKLISTVLSLLLVVGSIGAQSYNYCIVSTKKFNSSVTYPTKGTVLITSDSVFIIKKDFPLENESYKIRREPMYFETNTQYNLGSGGSIQVYPHLVKFNRRPRYKMPSQFKVSIYHLCKTIY